MEESAFFNKLRSAGNAAITILAPSDEAFQKIPASRLDAIMKDKEARLGISRVRSLCSVCMLHYPSIIVILNLLKIELLWIYFNMDTFCNIT